MLFSAALNCKMPQLEFCVHSVYRVAQCLPATIIAFIASCVRVWHMRMPVSLCVSSCLSGCQSACVCGGRVCSPFTNNIYAVYVCCRLKLHTAGLKLKLHYTHQRPQLNCAVEQRKWIAMPRQGAELQRPLGHPSLSRILLLHSFSLWAD